MPKLDTEIYSPVDLDAFEAWCLTSKSFAPATILAYKFWIKKLYQVESVSLESLAANLESLPPPAWLPIRTAWRVLTEYAKETGFAIPNQLDALFPQTREMKCRDPAIIRIGMFLLIGKFTPAEIADLYWKDVRLTVVQRNGIPVQAYLFKTRAIFAGTTTEKLFFWIRIWAGIDEARGPEDYPVIPDSPGSQLPMPRERLQRAKVLARNRAQTKGLEDLDDLKPSGI